jgi:hypothetical protein
LITIYSRIDLRRAYGSLSLFQFFAPHLVTILIERKFRRQNVTRPYIKQPGGLERLIGHNPLARIQIEHAIEEIERLRRHIVEFVAQAAPIHFLGLERVVKGQMYDVGPAAGRRSAARPRYQVELIRFGVGLENGLFGEEFAQYAATRPDVDARSVAFFAEEELGSAVPQSDYFVGVGSVFVVGVVEASETKIG